MDNEIRKYCESCKFYSVLGCQSTLICTDGNKFRAVDVQPVKHSHWFYPFSELDVNRCWECGFHVQDKINNVREMFHYCPHCGARMDGEVE